MGKFINIPEAHDGVPVAKVQKAQEVIQAMSEEAEPADDQKILFINTLCSLISDDGTLVARPERPEQLEKFHMF